MLNGIWYYAKTTKSGFSIRTKSTDEVICSTASQRYAARIINALDTLEGHMPDNLKVA